MTYTSPYTDAIKSIAPKHDPRHIEAYMRAEFGTLDHLGAERFRREVHSAVLCIKHGGKDMAERLARSYGM